MSAPYDANLSQLLTIAQSGDLGRLQTETAAMLSAWRVKDPALAEGLAFRLCKGLAAQAGHPAAVASMLDAAALAILKDQSLSPPVGYAVAILLMEDDDPAAARRLGSAWPTLRKERAAGVLAAWQAMRSQIDPIFNATLTAAPAAPSPPAATGLPAGAAPDAITDQSLRGQYQAALDDYNGKMSAFTRQCDLALNEPRMAREVQSYLMLAYSTDPAALDEVKALMDQYMVPSGVRSQVIQVLTP